MSTVNENVNNTQGIFPRAGNTVESLTPRYGTQSQEAHYGLPLTEVLDKDASEATSEANSEESLEREAADEDSEISQEAIDDMNRQNDEWRGEVVNQGDLEDFYLNTILPLEIAVQELAERILKHNKSAPHKI